MTLGFWLDFIVGQMFVKLKGAKLCSWMDYFRESFRVEVMLGSSELWSERWVWPVEHHLRHWFWVFLSYDPQASKIKCPDFVLIFATKTWSEYTYPYSELDSPSSINLHTGICLGKMLIFEQCFILWVALFVFLPSHDFSDPCPFGVNLTVFALVFPGKLTNGHYSALPMEGGPLETLNMRSCRTLSER